MKKQNDLIEKRHNRQIMAVMLIYIITALAFFVFFGVTRDGISTGINGFLKVQLMPSQMSFEYFKNATVSGTFLNVCLVGLSCLAVYKASGARLNGGSLMAFFLTLGFSFFGMNIINIWPCILGTFVFAVTTGRPFRTEVNDAVFSTSLAPFVSEMYFRYELFSDKPVAAIAAGVGVGLFAGFMMPIICRHMPNAHRGHTFFNAASSAGLLAILIYAIMFKSAGIADPTNTDVGGAVPEAVLGYAFVTAGICIFVGFILNGRTFKNATFIYRRPGYGCDFTARRTPIAIINIGVFEVFMMVFYIVTGAPLGGLTIAAVICAISVAACGGHIFNMLPIMIGYVLACCVFKELALSDNAIVLGLCFASALTPVSGGFGSIAGIAAGFMHAVMVKQVMIFYNAFCFYNGGFTCFVVAMILGTVLDYFFIVDRKYRWKPIPIRKKEAIRRLRQRKASKKTVTD